MRLHLWLVALLSLPSIFLPAALFAAELAGYSKVDATQVRCAT